LAYSIVIDYTNDLSIGNFLNSETCSDIGINAVQVNSVDMLSRALTEYRPNAIVLSTSTTSVSDMHALITGNVGQYNYIICTGEIKNKKDKQQLKLLQEEYNCNIIGSVVTDLLMLNSLITCIGDVTHVPHNSHTPQIVEDVFYKEEPYKEAPISDIEVTSTEHEAIEGHALVSPQVPEYKEEAQPNLPSRFVNNDDDDDVEF